jgi:hypothetical protein
MIYAVEMGSGVMIYIPSFIKIGSGIQKVTGGGYTETQTEDCISLLQGSRLKIKVNLTPRHCDIIEG